MCCDALYGVDVVTGRDFSMWSFLHPQTAQQAIWEMHIPAMAQDFVLKMELGVYPIIIHDPF